MAELLEIIFLVAAPTGVLYLLLRSQTLPCDRLIADLNAELAAYANIGARVKALEAAAAAEEAREWRPS